MKKEIDPSAICDICGDAWSYMQHCKECSKPEDYHQFRLRKDRRGHAP